MEEVERLLHLLLLYLLAAALGAFSLDLTYILSRCASLARHLRPGSLNHDVATIFLVSEGVDGIDLRFVDLISVDVNWRFVGEFHGLHDRGGLLTESTHGCLIPLETSHFLFFFHFWLFRRKMGLRESWRQNFKFSRLSFFESLWANRKPIFHLTGNLSRRELFLFWRRNSWRDRLSSHFDRFLVWTSRSGCPNLNSSSQESSAVDLSVLGAVTSRMRVNVVSLHVLPIHGSASSGFGICITISVECRLTKVGGHRRIRKPSRAQLEILKLGIKLFPLVLIQLSLLLLQNPLGLRA